MCWTPMWGVVTKEWGQKNVRPRQFSRQQDYKDKMINSMVFSTTRSSSLLKLYLKTLTSKAQSSKSNHSEFTLMNYRCFQLQFHLTILSAHTHIIPLDHNFQSYS